MDLFVSDSVTVQECLHESCVPVCCAVVGFVIDPESVLLDLAWQIPTVTFPNLDHRGVSICSDVHDTRWI